VTSSAELARVREHLVGLVDAGNKMSGALQGALGAAQKALDDYTANWRGDRARSLVENFAAYNVKCEAALEAQREVTAQCDWLRMRAEHYGSAMKRQETIIARATAQQAGTSDRAPYPPEAKVAQGYLDRLWNEWRKSVSTWANRLDELIPVLRAGSASIEPSVLQHPGPEGYHDSYMRAWSTHVLGPRLRQGSHYYARTQWEKLPPLSRIWLITTRPDLVANYLTGFLSVEERDELLQQAVYPVSGDYWFWHNEISANVGRFWIEIGAGASLRVTKNSDGTVLVEVGRVLEAGASFRPKKENGSLRVGVAGRFETTGYLLFQDQATAVAEVDRLIQASRADLLKGVNPRFILLPLPLQAWEIGKILARRSNSEFDRLFRELQTAHGDGSKIEVGVNVALTGEVEQELWSAAFEGSAGTGSYVRTSPDGQATAAIFAEGTISANAQGHVKKVVHGGVEQTLSYRIELVKSQVGLQAVLSLSGALGPRFQAALPSDLVSQAGKRLDSDLVSQAGKRLKVTANVTDTSTTHAHIEVVLDVNVENSKIWASIVENLATGTLPGDQLQSLYDHSYVTVLVTSADSLTVTGGVEIKDVVAVEGRTGTAQETTVSAFQKPPGGEFYDQIQLSEDLQPGIHAGLPEHLRRIEGR
jgi:hypothetical protein